MNLLRLSWKNIRIKPLSTFLSLLLFGLGVGIIVLLMLLNTQLKAQFDRNLAGVDMVVGAKGSPLQLILSSIYHIDNPTGNITLRDVRILEKHPSVAPLIQRTIPLALGDSYKGFRIVGTEHSYVALYDSTAFAEFSLWSQLNEVTIGHKVAQDLGLRVGDTFQSTHGLLEEGDAHEGHRLRVVSILPRSRTVLDKLILTSIETVRAAHAHEDEAPDFELDEEDQAALGEEHDHHDHDGETADHHDPHEATDHATPTQADLDDPQQGITAMLVFFRSPMGHIRVPNFINQNTNMQTAVPAYEANKLYELLGVGTDALRVLAMVIVLVSGLSIFISLFNALKERRYELALLRVMGASRTQLFLLIILEGLLIALLGYVVGTLLGHGGMALLGQLAEDSYQYNFDGWRFLPAEIWIAVSALGLGFLAAFIPALGVYRVDIAETLAGK